MLSNCKSTDPPTPVKKIARKCDYYIVLKSKFLFSALDLGPFLAVLRYNTTHPQSQEMVYYRLNAAQANMSVACRHDVSLPDPRSNSNPLYVFHTPKGEVVACNGRLAGKCWVVKFQRSGKPAKLEKSTTYAMDQPRYGAALLVTEEGFGLIGGGSSSNRYGTRYSSAYFQRFQDTTGSTFKDAIPTQATDMCLVRVITTLFTQPQGGSWNKLYISLRGLLSSQIVARRPKLHRRRICIHIRRQWDNLSSFSRCCDWRLRYAGALWVFCIKGQYYA